MAGGRGVGEDRSILIIYGRGGQTAYLAVADYLVFLQCSWSIEPGTSFLMQPPYVWTIDTASVKAIGKTVRRRYKVLPRTTSMSTRSNHCRQCTIVEVGEGRNYAWFRCAYSPSQEAGGHAQATTHFMLTKPNQVVRLMHIFTHVVGRRNCQY